MIAIGKDSMAKKQRKKAKRNRPKKCPANSNKEVVIEMLLMTRRTGIQGLIKYMEDGGYFEAPAGMKNHNAFKGGLVEHSINVFELLIEYNKLFFLEKARDPGQVPEKVTPENLVIACLLHDLCKMNAYLGEEGSYTLNPVKPKGHAALSIKMASAFIELEPLEYMMIKYHMGVYGLKEFGKKGEYKLRGKGMAHAWYHNPFVKLMSICDEMATMRERRTAEVKAEAEAKDGKIAH
jgi:hypothetical protein